MKYDKFAFITPPRAENRIPPGLLDGYEARGWWAQRKLNGTNSVIFVSPEKTLRAMTRHGEDHKMWSFSDDSAAVFRNLPGRGWWVINAELMHSKGGGMRDVNYVHDVLVADGDWLLGSTYQQRWGILSSVLPGKEDGWRRIVNAKTWLANNVVSGFKDAFSSLVGVEFEGLVLKDPLGKLATKGVPWAVKCRRPAKNYGF